MNQDWLAGVVVGVGCTYAGLLTFVVHRPVTGIFLFGTTLLIEHYVKDS